MFQITNLLLLMMVTLFVLPASAFMYASGSTENNDDGSSDSGSTENNDDGSSDSGSTSSNSAETVQQQSADFENTILNIHNQERANVQVPTLTWSNILATDAQGYANELASMGLGPDDIPPHSGDQSQGENLSWGSSNGYSLETSVQQWAGEKSNYEVGHVMSDDDFVEGAPMIGHYTQMVWKDTTEVGCGQANNTDATYLVCRYTPPGNVIGETPY